MFATAFVSLYRICSKQVTGIYHRDPSTFSVANSVIQRYYPAMGTKTFSRALCGLESQHGMMPDDSGKKSTGKINQDRGCYKYPFCGDEHCALLCVFDGHGPEVIYVFIFISFGFSPPYSPPYSPRAIASRNL